jgi:CBS domain containing-hemolysin-like protein
MPSRREARIQPFILPLSRIPVEASLNNALRTLLARREHMALIEDGQQRIVGLVTLEDLLEEIVGDLTDEFDTLPDETILVAEGRWKVGGGARMTDVATRTGITGIPGDLTATLSDWLRARQERDPAAGDTVTIDNATFTVIQTRRRKAHRVLIEIH